MRRSRAVALIAASTIVSALMAPPAAATRPDDRRPLVTGTFSTGAGKAWQPLPPVRFGGDSGGPVDATVVVDPSRTRQRYTGIGFSLDETSVSNLWKLSPDRRDAAIRLLADPRTGAGLDRFRITIGSPDLIEHLPFWSEDELPAGVTEDFALRYFSIQRDLDLHIIDTIKLIQRHNPRATFFASAWSAPAWMKTNNRFLGEVALNPGSSTDYHQVGKLRDDCIDVLARYYVEFVQAYARHGIHIDALTLLNEPGMDVVYPAMDISVAQQQRLAVAIDTELAAARLDTGLYVHDFNFWDWRDPNSTASKNYYRIFDDPRAERAADGIAFHPYWGDPAVMRDAYEQYRKPVHLTETSDVSPATVLADLRLDASSYVLWAPATDQNGGTLHWTPARDNNLDWDEVARTTAWPDRLVTVDTATGDFRVRDELYQLGQFARHLDGDDVRVASSAPSGGIGNVVFRDGRDGYTAILGNTTGTDRKVRFVLAGQSFVTTVPAHAYATLRWRLPLPHRRNHPPVPGAAPAVTADQYSTVRVPLAATDADGDRLAFYATDLPDGVSVDAATGVVTLHPTVPGERDLRFTVTDGRAGADLTVRLTVAPHGAPIGERVEAEAYVAQHGWTEGGANFIENTPSASGGRNVGWTAPGNWLRYRLDVATPGTYDLELRVANGSGAAAPDALSVRDAAGQGLATVSVPDTGGWAAYRSVHARVTLAAGAQDVTLYCESGGFNLDYFRLS
ncbi:carbohydrate-binding protein [Krasilnikovia sp. M28-CT-15]|uniref:carbohydrate-binding protein n=1 Tax=Krasilnikovia sp. M28-CT-15 TaxID=3373540 RepID=UPI0038773D41